MGDNLISYMLKDADVFVTYADDTKPLAEQLTSALQKQGFHPWVDFKDLHPGQLWREELDRALDRARSVVIVVSPKSKASSWQEAEWRAALARVWSDSGKTMIPVVVGGDETPPFLRSWVSLRVDPVAEPADWTVHVVDALRSNEDRVLAHSTPEARRERLQRLDEIRQTAEDLFDNKIQ